MCPMMVCRPRETRIKRGRVTPQALRWMVDGNRQKYQRWKAEWRF